MTLFTLIHEGEIQLASSDKIIRAEVFSELLNIESLLKKCDEEIEQMRSDCQKECEELKQNAINTGHQEGLVSFNKHLIYLDQKVKQMEHEMQKLVLPLALKAAKKIVGTELKIYPETIVDIVLQALKSVRQCHEVKIFVSKEDKPLLETEKEKLKSLFDHLRILTIEEREGLTKGSCIIETEAGIINASLDNLWRALEAAFESFSKR